MDRALIVDDEEMPFSPENQEWIKSEIDRAIRLALNPLTRSRKLLRSLKDWGITGSLITVPIALIGIIVALGIRIGSDIREESAFRGATEYRLKSIEASLLVLRAKAVASNPTDSENQAEAKNVLATAKKESIPIPLPLVEQTGRKFIDASENNPKAWNVALDFISYRSSTYNVSDRPKNPMDVLQDQLTFHMFRFDNKPRPELYHDIHGYLPMDQAARYDEIGEDMNKDKTRGTPWLTLRGGATMLDGYHIRRTSFENVEVHYKGGPVILENVLFINCTFVFENTDKGRKLAYDLVSTTKIIFRSSA